MSDTVSRLVDQLGGGFTPDVSPPYDLRRLYRNVKRLPTELPELPFRRNVRLLPDRPGGPVTTTPAPVVGVIDGVQPPARALAWRDGRPVGLIYVAAGCLGLQARRPVALEERLVIVASDLDRDWAETICAGVPVAVVAHRYPAEIVTAIKELQGALRHRLERDVLRQMRTEDHLIVVDGDLRNVPSDGPPVAGVVKSHSAQYLTDETEINGLPMGHLSATFLIPATTPADPDRWSAYLRLQPADQSGWTHGLVRLEATAAELLEPVAAWALTDRQAPGTDRRWPVHLASMAACERVLRARIPAVM